MFYFESIKIQTSTPNTPYALTLKLESNKAYFLTSQDKFWLEQLFLFTKNKTGYKYGNWLINNYDLIHINRQQFNNFAYQNLSFCDDTLIFNKNLSVKKMLNIYTRFFQKNSTFAKNILSLTGLSKGLLSTKIKDLDKFRYLKLKLCLSCFKHSEYLICNFTKDLNLSGEQEKDLSSCINKIVNDYQKTIICFVDENYPNENKICLDKKEYLSSNKTVTISLQKYQKPGYKIWKNKLSVFTNIFEQINWEWILMFVINIALIAMCVWSMAVPNLVTNESSGETIKRIVEFSKNNKILWTFFEYTFYVLVYANMLIWWKIMNKKRKKYNEFLDNVHVGNITKAAVWPTIYFLANATSIILGFMVINIYFVIEEIVIYLWFALPLFLFIIYIVVLILGLALQINQTINPNTFKQTFINIISK